MSAFVNNANSVEKLEDPIPVIQSNNVTELAF